MPRESLFILSFTPHGPASLSTAHIEKDTKSSRPRRSRHSRTGQDNSTPAYTRRKEYPFDAIQRISLDGQKRFDPSDLESRNTHTHTYPHYLPGTSRSFVNKRSYILSLSLDSISPLFTAFIPITRYLDARLLLRSFNICLVQMVLIST